MAYMVPEIIMGLVSSSLRIFQYNKVTTSEQVQDVILNMFNNWSDVQRYMGGL